MSTRQNFQGLTPLSILRAPEPTASLSFADIAFFLKLRWLTIVSVATACCALAVVYVMLASPTYVASTQLLLSAGVDTRSDQRPDVEEGFIEGQLEVAQSTDVLTATVNRLGLMDDADFAAAASLSRRAITAITHALGYTSDPTLPGPSNTSKPDNHLDRVTAQLRGATWVRRIGRSAIIELSASAKDPVQAASIANIMAQEYMAKNLAMKTQATRQYSDWLSGLVFEQQKNLTDAANALASFQPNPRDQYKLAELQSQVEARRTLFQNTLTLFTETRQRISSPVSDATIVSPATAPLGKARPRSALIVGFALMIGIGAGFMGAMARHVSDRRIRRRGPLMDILGTAPVTFVKRRSHLAYRSNNSHDIPAKALHARMVSRSLTLEELTITPIRLRTKRKAAVGIAGTSHGVGASTIARELAAQSAAAGIRTLLIDAVPPKTSPGPQQPGLAEVSDNLSSLDDVVIRLTSTLSFIGPGDCGEVSPAMQLSAQNNGINIAKLKSQYEAIFIDIAAVSHSHDVHALAPQLDGIFLVGAYGKTSLDEVATFIAGLNSVGGELLGAVINKASGKR